MVINYNKEIKSVAVVKSEPVIALMNGISRSRHDGRDRSRHVGRSRSRHGGI